MIATITPISFFMAITPIVAEAGVGSGNRANGTSAASQPCFG
jgi:hypothetical protein